MIVDAEHWWGLDLDAAAEVARAVAGRTGAELVEVRAHEYAGRGGPVALFDVGGQRFAFVPGGEVPVGFDAGRFEPAPGQAASFAESAEEYGIEDDLREFLGRVTSPARRAVVPPLLVAVEAVEAGAVVVPADHPEIVGRVAAARDRPGEGEAPGRIEWHRSARVVLRPDWTVEAAWVLGTPSYDGEVERLAALGQRLLTPDEWEHACGAGATTLFRWGDGNPESDPWSATTGPHRTPNRFGLRIAEDPYRDERTAERGVVCGGDGGSMVCGGAGEFLEWLTIATAYRDAEHAAAVAADDTYGTMLVRPAIAVG